MIRRTLIAVALLIPGAALARGGGHCSGHHAGSGKDEHAGEQKIAPQGVRAQSVHAASPVAETIHVPGPTDRPTAGTERAAEPAPEVSTRGSAAAQGPAEGVEAR